MAIPSVPFVQQMEAVECGAASLTMVLHHHGHFAPLEELREACGVSRDGATASAIVKAARTYHLKPRARRLEPGQLAEVAGPAIIHWDMNHFVVLVKWTPEATWINDPAIGPRKVAAEQFDKSFTGICIEFTPSDDFEPRKRERRSVARYLALLRNARSSIIAVSLAAFVISVLGLAVPLGTQVVVDWVVRRHQHDWLSVVAAAMACAFLLLYAARWLRGRVLARVRLMVDAKLGPQLLEHMLSLPMRFFSQRQTGDLASRLASVQAIRELCAERTVSLLVDTPLLLGYLALMFAYEWRLALVVTGFAAAYAVAFMVARAPRTTAAREQIVKDVKEGAELHQAIQGIVTLKSAGREATAHRRWLNLFVDALNYRERGARLDQRTDAILMLIQGLAPACVLTWGTVMAIGGTLTLGQLLGFLFLQSAVMLPLTGVIQSLLAMQVLGTHVARMDDVLTAALEPTGDRSPPPLSGQLRFDDVTFRYSKFGPAVLKGVSFDIRRGQKVAFVGSSGSGKSTIARLLLGLYRPESGRVFVDGQLLDELDLDSVRRQMGAVLQETTLFEGTLRENLSLYKPSATLDEIVTATRAAQIHEDILGLPEGYQTRVSADGAPLSGGQRQRVALARAILLRPPILIADEATSALDTVTEEAVERYLSTRSCTRVVIAHRLSTVRDADKIFVLERGRIVESGRHEELLALGGRYAELHDSPEEAVPQSIRDDEEQAVRPEELAEFAPLSRLRPAQLAVLASRMQRRAIAEDSEILSQGERGEGLFLVVEGEFDIILREPGLEPWNVGNVSDGAVLGEVSLLDGSPVSASVVCRRPATVLHLPRRHFNMLRESGDEVGMDLVLALGALVAERVRESTKEQEKIGHGGGFEHEADEEGLDEEDLGTLRLMAMSATAVGGALTDGELESLERMGGTRTLAAGELLFRANDPSLKSYVLLSGRIAVTLEKMTGYLSVVRPGELFGELALFDEGERAADCVALDEATLFEIDLPTFRSLLRAGDTTARKLLRSFTHALTRVFRLSQLRRREALAMVEKEHERAVRAREEADQVARREVVTVSLGDDERPPHVAADAERSIAACVVSLLRFHGRAASLAEIAEAFEAHDGHPLSPANMRSYGFLVRRLELDAHELEAMDEPIVARLDEGAIVVEGCDGRTLQVMDPGAAQRDMTLADFAKRFTGDAYELRVDDTSEASLMARVWRALGRRRGALGLSLVGTICAQLAALATPLAISLLVEQAYPARDLDLVGLIAIAIAIILVTRVVLSVQINRALFFLQTKLDRDLLDQLVRHVLSLPLTFFERHPSGSILQRFGAFVVLRELVGTRGLRAALGLPILVVALTVLTLLSPAVAAVAWGMTFVYAVSVAATLPVIRKLAERERTVAAEQKTRLLEVLRGVTTLRASGTRGLGLRKWLPSWLLELKTAASQSQLQSGLSAWLELLRLAAVGSMACYGAALHLNGELSLGALLAALAVAETYFESLQGVTEYTVAFSRARSRVRMLAETFDEPPEQPATAVRAMPGRLRGGIALEHVTFAYADDAPPVIDDVSLSIPAGAKVALVGPSGSGKSTLGKLLLGLYQPRSGRILMDGKDLAQLDVQAVRQQVGTVPQDSFLFSGSIRNNLSLCAPDATMDELWEAADRAAARSLIERLPMQMETLVSEGGGTFSGGERQRLALARALAAQPAMLLMDEATSALDNVSQAHVETSLARLACTRITIAHRLSTVMDADVIVVLERGRVVEQGCHDELLALGGAYARLVAPQLG